MKRAAWLAALGAAAVLSTRRGRGAIGAALVSAGVALIPEPEPDPARDERIRSAVLNALAGLDHAAAWSARQHHSRNGAGGCPL